MSLADAERILLERIYQVLGPYPTDPTGWPSSDRVDLFRQRFGSALVDLELPEHIGVRADVADGGIVISTRDWKAAERLLRVLEHYAARHPWFTTRW